MILEAATAAAMYWADRTIADSSSLVPQMRPELTCRHRDPKRVQQCLTAKMHDQTDPYAALWDADWVSSITPVNEGEQKNTSAKAANPKHGGSKGAVASKPHP